MANLLPIEGFLPDINSVIVERYTNQEPRALQKIAIIGLSSLFYEDIEIQLLYTTGNNILSKRNSGSQIQPIEGIS